jgi:hypothetical protein
LEDWPKDCAEDSLDHRLGDCVGRLENRLEDCMAGWLDISLENWMEKHEVHSTVGCLPEHLL